MSNINLKRINIDEPRFDQSTYFGRAKHFFLVTNPLNIFCSPKELDHSKYIIEKYRKGEKIEGINEEKLWRYKNIYDSAHHPETGQRQIIIGRMSAQVPMNMIITGCMLAFYKTTSQVVFWQWFNQSFNAVVNYTNRSGNSEIPLFQLGLSYGLATGGALTTALGLNSLVKKASPLIGRFVPFCAVAAANCVNIPMMRLKEIREGILVFDEDNHSIGNSKKAANLAISQVTLSRIGMAFPGMTIPPFIMNYLDKKGTLRRMPWINAPLQVLICGAFLTFTTPLCCALFPQKGSIAVENLEKEIQEKVLKIKVPPQRLYYNKGL